MNINDLYDLLVGAPTGGAESSALSVLTSLARNGHLAAAQALLRALATALGFDSALPLVTNVASMDELLAADLPAPLYAYAVALEPRTFIANAERIAKRPDSDDMRSFRRLIITRDVLQHEALKAHVLTALSGLIGMWPSVDDATPSSYMRLLDRVMADTCIVEGRNSDDTLRFGREKLLEIPGINGLYSIITHELGHNVLDLMMGRGTNTEAPGHESSLNDLAAALPGIMEASCRRRGQPFEANDTRIFRTVQGVALLCTHERLTLGSYFHMSLMQAAGPIDLHVGATYAYLVLGLAGINPSDVAVAWTARGALHFGFRGEEQDVLRAAPPQVIVAARVQEALTNGPAWINELRVNGKLLESEVDLPTALGVEPHRPRVYGNNSEDAYAHLDVAAQAGALPSLGELSEPEAAAVLTSAWCAAAPTVLQRLLREKAGMPAQLRASDWPLSEIGGSIYAMRDEHGVVSLHGPTVSDIRLTLLTLRDAGVPLDGPADSDGRSLLTRAVFKNVNLVRFALDCGVDPNRLSEDGETALMASSVTGNVAVAEALIAAGASIVTQDRNGKTALHRAAEERHDELLRCLLSHGAKVDQRDSDGNTALMLAQTSTGVTALCDAGASVRASSLVGLTALHIAAQNGNAEVVRALLARGADPNAPARTGETPLHYAVLAYEGTDCLAALLDAGADIDEESDDGMTALMVAARSADVEAVQLLLERGAHVNARTINGNTALIMASDGRNEWSRDFSFSSRIEECLRLLVASGADINAANDEGFTALHAATWGFAADRVQCLIDLGADPEIAARDGSTPLSLAQAQEHTVMVEALVAATRKKGNA